MHRATFRAWKNRTTSRGTRIPAEGLKASATTFLRSFYRPVECVENDRPVRGAYVETWPLHAKAGRALCLRGLRSVSSRLRDPEILRDLGNLCAGAAIMGDAHDIAAELLGGGAWVGHGAHPSLQRHSAPEIRCLLAQQSQATAIGQWGLVSNLAELCVGQNRMKNYAFSGKNSLTRSKAPCAAALSLPKPIA